MVKAVAFALAPVVVSLCSAQTIIQPGAPEQPPKVITPEQATDLSKVRHTDADVTFMQGMIAHHAQALEMTALAPGRTTSTKMRLLMKRIELSQATRSGSSQSWLRAAMPPARFRHDFRDPSGGIAVPLSSFRFVSAQPSAGNLRGASSVGLDCDADCPARRMHASVGRRGWGVSVAATGQQGRLGCAETINAHSSGALGNYLSIMQR